MESEIILSSRKCPGTANVVAFLSEFCDTTFVPGPPVAEPHILIVQAEWKDTISQHMRKEVLEKESDPKMTRTYVALCLLMMIT